MTTLTYHQPFRLPPNRVWRSYLGGKLLDFIERIERPEDAHFPEDWIGSATRATNPGARPASEGIGQAVGADGKPIAADVFFQRDPVQVLGSRHLAAFGANPNLLVKLLDSSIRLHIQAHPTRDWARQHLGAVNGKTEAWLVLAQREPQSTVILGFQRPPKPRSWIRTIETQDLKAMMACFDPVPVSPGDVLLVRGGVPHAVGAGLLLMEVQEPTDYVVRCEYARGGYELPASARHMGLPIEEIQDLFDYCPYPAELVKDIFGPHRRISSASHAGCEVVLLGPPETDAFEVREIATEGNFTLPLDGRFSMLLVSEGEGTIIGDAVELHVQTWSRVLLPSVLETVQLRGRFRAVRCLPPAPALTV